jgi:moderate conductance mechanosensitive channel
MTAMTDFVADLSLLSRILLIVVLAAAAHLVVRSVRTGADRWMSAGQDRHAAFRRHPKIASLVTILVSAFTFTIYFIGVGLVLREVGVPLTGYLTSASVIGLAVGFGSQGLVQDVVAGLTLIFSDVMHVGDVVDVAGQTGRVESVGLRFTVLVNVLDQRIYIPNRNIVHIGRYRGGCIRGYLDVQLPREGDEGEVVRTVRAIAEGMHGQHHRVILTPPEVMGVRLVEPGGWRFVRVKFRLWPGQGPLIETVLRQRLVAAMRAMDESYMDWMVTVTYRAE